MCEAGLTVEFQSRLKDITRLLSAELVSPVPCMTGRLTGNQFWVWYWCNKFRDRIVLHTPNENSFVDCPITHVPLFLNYAMRALHTDCGKRHGPEAWTWMIKIKVEEQYWR